MLQWVASNVSISQTCESFRHACICFVQVRHNSFDMRHTKTLTLQHPALGKYAAAFLSIRFVLVIAQHLFTDTYHSVCSFLFLAFRLFHLWNGGNTLRYVALQLAQREQLQYVQHFHHSQTHPIRFITHKYRKGTKRKGFAVMLDC